MGEGVAGGDGDQELAPHIETLKTTYADNPDIAKGLARYDKGVEAWNQSAQE